MTNAKTRSKSYLVVALTAEGLCLLVPLLTAAWNLWKLPQPPPLIPYLPANLQPYLFLLVQALLYGALAAPLRLWRVAIYRRACGRSTVLSPRLIFTAVGWRWRLWWCRACGMAVAAAPTAFLWGFGALIAPQNNDSHPLFWLIGGGLSLLCSIGAVAVWQCRYTLAPLYILEGFSAAAAMALSARSMRSRTAAYINFIGGELPRLLACTLLVPTIWLLPDFRRRRLKLLSDWMQPAP